MTAVVVVQQSAAVATWTASQTATPSLPGVATVGNTLIMPFGHGQFDQTSQPVTASGYTAANAIVEASNTYQAGVLYKTAAGGETGTTASVPGVAGNSYGDTFLLEVSGLNGYVSADSNQLGSTGAVTSLSVSSSNPLSESSGIAVVVFQGGTSAGVTWPPAAGGWTSIDAGGSSNGCCMAYKIFSSNAQLSAIFATMSSADNVAGSITIFKATSSPITATSSGDDQVYDIKKSTAVRPLIFRLVSSTDGTTPVTGAAGTCTVTISKNGGAFATPAGAISEISIGYYEVAPNATDSNTFGPIALNASNTGAVTFSRIVAQVVGYDPYAVDIGLTEPSEVYAAKTGQATFSSILRLLLNFLGNTTWTPGSTTGTLTVLKEDGSTTAAVFTGNDPVNPSQLLRTS